jgi:hypothetical protein
MTTTIYRIDVAHVEDRARRAGPEVCNDYGVEMTPYEWERHVTWKRHHRRYRTRRGAARAAARIYDDRYPYGEVRAVTRVIEEP